MVLTLTFLFVLYPADVSLASISTRSPISFNTLPTTLSHLIPACLYVNFSDTARLPTVSLATSTLACSLLYIANIYLQSVIVLIITSPFPALLQVLLYYSSYLSTLAINRTFLAAGINMYRFQLLVDFLHTVPLVQ